MGEPLETLVTPDGRELAFATWGDPSGFPVLSLHGTPGCRLSRWPDEDVYRRLGVRVVTHDRAGYGRSTRRVVYLCTAMLTAASVATCGIIGFVGLVVPHAVRTVARPLHRSLLPLVFVVGGSFLVLSDVVARTVVRPLELPVGVITALVGVPLFALLLRRTLA